MHDEQLFGAGGHKDLDGFVVIAVGSLVERARRGGGLGRPQSESGSRRPVCAASIIRLARKRRRLQFDPAAELTERAPVQKKSPAIRSGASGRERWGVRGKGMIPSCFSNAPVEPLFLGVLLGTKIVSLAFISPSLRGTNGNLERLPALRGALP